MSLLIGSCICACADETVLPVSDVSTGAWEDSTGGDNDGALWDEIDDDPADDATTFVRLSTSGGTHTLAQRTFECNVSDPSGSGFSSTDYSFRRRVSRTASLGETMHMKLLRNSVVVKDVEIGWPASANTWTGNSQNFVPAGYDNLSILFEVTVVSGGSVNIDVTQGKCDHNCP